ARFEGCADIEDIAQVLPRQHVEIEEGTRYARARYFRGAHARPGDDQAVCRAAAVRSRMPRASSIWLSSMIKGGSRRTTLSPAPALSRWLARNLAMTSVLGRRHFRPIISPSPRT